MKRSGRSAKHNWPTKQVGNGAKRNGNWESVTKDGVQETRTHNDVHELTVMGATGLSYDAKGNLTVNAANATFTWDIDNHLKHIEPDTPGIADDETDYEYDALGRRVAKQTGPLKRVFVSAGAQVLAEYETGSLVRSYVYGSYIDDTLAMGESAETTYYHRDRQYNTIALTDNSGTTIEYAAYTPYGQLTVTDAQGSVLQAPSSSNRYYYTGRYLDGGSLWYFRARYFDDQMGRFISRDPIGYVDGTSLYAGYFAERLRVDPTGQWVWLVPVVAEQVLQRAVQKAVEDVQEAMSSKVGQLVSENIVAGACQGRARTGSGHEDFDLTKQGDHQSADVRDAVEESMEDILKEYRKKTDEIEERSDVVNLEFSASYKLWKRYQWTCNRTQKKVGYRGGYVAEIALVGTAFRVTELANGSTRRDMAEGKKLFPISAFSPWTQGSKDLYTCCCE